MRRTGGRDLNRAIRADIGLATARRAPLPELVGSVPQNKCIAK
ncbi:hypothetical protein [Streptomyces sp. NPDC002467]